MADASSDEEPRMGYICQLLTGLAIVAYVFALVLPAFAPGGPNLFGYETLIYISKLPWYANPLGWVALQQSFGRRRLYAWLFSTPAVGLSLLILRCDSGLGLGGYAWLASFICLLIANLKQRLDPTEHPAAVVSVAR